MQCRPLPGRLEATSSAARAFRGIRRGPAALPIRLAFRASSGSTGMASSSPHRGTTASCDVVGACSEEENRSCWGGKGAAVCSLGCSGRAELHHAHDAECPAQAVRCQAHSSGCEVTCARRELGFHTRSCFWRRVDDAALSALRETTMRAVLMRAAAQLSAAEEASGGCTPERPSADKPAPSGRSFNKLFRPLMTCGQSHGQTTSPTGKPPPSPRPYTYHHRHHYMVRCPVSASVRIYLSRGSPTAVLVSLLSADYNMIILKHYAIYYVCIIFIIRILFTVLSACFSW